MSQDATNNLAAEAQDLLNCVARAELLARTYLDAIEWILLFSDAGLERPEVEPDEDGPGWSPEVSSSCDGYLLPSVMRPAWDPMFRWAQVNHHDQDAETLGVGMFVLQMFVARHPLDCLYGALIEAVVPLEPALRQLTEWKAGVPFAWLEQVRIFDGAVKWDETTQREYSLDSVTVGGPLAVLRRCPSPEEIVERLRKESRRFDIALGIVRREMERRSSRKTAAQSGTCGPTADSEKKPAAVPAPAPTPLAMIVELRERLERWRDVIWKDGGILYRVQSALELGDLWNEARETARRIPGAPPPPPMPPPFVHGQPSTEPQEGQAALDILIRWCDQVKAWLVTETPPTSEPAQAEAEAGQDGAGAKPTAEPAAPVATGTATGKGRNPPTGPVERAAEAEPQGEPGTPADGDRVWFSATDAARYIGVNESTVRRWIRDHKINIVGEDGTKYHFSLNELNAKREVQAKKKSSHNKAPH